MIAPAAPRPVFCVTEHAYCDRAIAENVCRGRFEHQGVSLDLGVEPDWLGAPLPPDREWRLEWVKFYYGLNLARAFCDTGERRFQDTWERLVRSFIRQVPISVDPSDVIARRIQNWIYAWSSFAGGDRFEGLHTATADLVLESLAAQVAYLRTHLTRERNHRTLELYALFIAALALPALDPDRGLLDFAIDALQQNLLQDVGIDGVHRERSTHYHHVVLRSFLGARENARRFDLRFTAQFDQRLAHACDFAMHVHRPDGTIPALSDSDSGSYLDLLALAADLFARSDWLYVATRGAAGEQPAGASASFPIGGYFIQRSGWGGSDSTYDGERFLAFDCGPLGDGGHGHYDALSVDITGGGRSLVVDPGRYTYCDDPPHWRRWFKSTAAHNTVSIDRRDQTPYHRGKPKRGVAQARLLQRLIAPDMDVLWGEVTSPEYDVIHRRRIIFVAGKYWIIHDSLTGSTPHRYDLRFHLAPGTATLVTADVRPGVRAPGLGVIVAPPWPIAIEDGWVSRQYGIKEAAPIVVATADGVEDADFFSLVAPLADSAPLPAFDITRQTIEDEEVVVAEVEFAADSGVCIDRILWTASGRAARLTGSDTVAAAVALDVAPLLVNA